MVRPRGLAATEIKQRAADQGHTQGAPATATRPTQTTARCAGPGIAERARRRHAGSGTPDRAAAYERGPCGPAAPRRGAPSLPQAADPGTPSTRARGEGSQPSGTSTGTRSNARPPPRLSAASTPGHAQRRTVVEAVSDEARRGTHSAATTGAHQPWPSPSLLCHASAMDQVRGFSATRAPRPPAGRHPASLMPPATAAATRSLEDRGVRKRTGHHDTAQMFSVVHRERGDKTARTPQLTPMSQGIPAPRWPWTPSSCPLQRRPGPARAHVLS